MRETFIHEVANVVPVHPVTVPIAIRAGFLDGQNQARGARVPLPDLLIAVTALELGYSVGTANLRHFKQVHGLTVVEL
jgi:predicted nucleic acid-binding protein